MEESTTAKKLSKRDRDAFNAIFSFVSDIWDVFGTKNVKKVTPLVLYHRLVESTKLSDSDSIEKILNGFKTFFITHGSSILTGQLDNIPENTKILYGSSERICLEIQKFIYKTKNDSDTREAIRSHLLTISCILEPDQSKISELEKFSASDIHIDTSTKEGEFINKLMQKAKNSMKNVNTSNPMAAVAGMFQSGIVQDMTTGLQKGIASGEMKMDRLLGAMQTAIGSVLPSDATSGETSNTDTSTDTVTDVVTPENDNVPRVEGGETNEKFENDEE